MKNAENISPIGVFDSGIGGLTVLKKLSAFLPQESMVYFGDTARVPYGSKSNETVIEYAIQDSGFLLNKGVKLIVVACNTASAIALDVLQQKFRIPVMGMIEPGASAAIKASRNKRIGVIGTNATINNKAYSLKLKQLDPELEIFEKACPLFVPLAEEGWTEHKATYLIAEEYLGYFEKLNIDTLILGCTHYPVLINVIRQVVGNSVQLIDSGEAASLLVKDLLQENNLLSNEKEAGRRDFFVSDLPSKFKSIAEIFLGSEIETLIKVDLDELTKQRLCF